MCRPERRPWEHCRTLSFITKQILEFVPSSRPMALSESQITRSRLRVLIHSPSAAGHSGKRTQSQTRPWTQTAVELDEQNKHRGPSYIRDKYSPDVLQFSGEKVSEMLQNEGAVFPLSGSELVSWVYFCVFFCCSCR